MSTKVIVGAGGAGAMGQITVRDLVETAADDLDIVVADSDQTAAKQLARNHAAKRDISAHRP